MHENFVNYIILFSFMGISNWNQSDGQNFNLDPWLNAQTD